MVPPDDEHLNHTRFLQQLVDSLNLEANEAQSPRFGVVASNECDSCVDRESHAALTADRQQAHEALHALSATQPACEACGFGAATRLLANRRENADAVLMVIGGQYPVRASCPTFTGKRAGRVTLKGASHPEPAGPPTAFGRVRRCTAPCVP